MSWKRFENKSTSDLISLFQNGDGSVSDSDDAFLSLVFRFRGDILKKTEIGCKRFGYDPVIASMLVENIFGNYARSRAFDITKSNTANYDLAFKNYLYRIANNTLIDYHRNEVKKSKGKIYDGTEYIITELPTDFEINDLSLSEQVHYKAIRSLSYSHRVVYLTYKVYEKNGVNLPRSLQKKLREHLNIKQSTVRSYKLEAKKIIEAHITSMNIASNHYIKGGNDE